VDGLGLGPEPGIAGVAGVTGVSPWPPLLGGDSALGASPTTTGRRSGADDLEVLATTQPTAL